jgi:phosphate transport system substrate-binding protein
MKAILTLVVSTIGAFPLHAENATATQKLTGKVIIDGSSTVFPISEAVAEDFQKANRDVKISVAASGTGGGFKKFCKGETDISGASRPIENKTKPAEAGKPAEKSEVETCTANGIAYVELPIAYDGIAVVVNKANTWAKNLTAAELKKIWEPGSKITKWSEVRAGFPDTKISLYGPGPEHGTFDYFTQAIVGKEKSIRTDFNAANPDALVVAVKGDKNALAYFGYAYYIQNKNSLNIVAVDNGAGKGAVLPSEKTIVSGEYQPLSRPIFIYVSEKALDRPEVKAFANYYLKVVPTVASQVGYAALKGEVYPLIQKRLDTRVIGTLYTDADKKSLTIPELLGSAKKNSSASKK